MKPEEKKTNGACVLGHHEKCPVSTDEHRCICLCHQEKKCNCHLRYHQVCDLCQGVARKITHSSTIEEIVGEFQKNTERKWMRPQDDIFDLKQASEWIRTTLTSHTEGLIKQMEGKRFDDVRETDTLAQGDDDLEEHYQSGWNAGLQEAIDLLRKSL